MPARDRKASTIDLAEDLSVLSPERAKEFLVAALEPDTRSGVLRFSKVPSVIVRPEAIVNIQRQLEQTIGGSSKGILYLSGERSARDGMNPFESIVSTRAPLTLANARRLMDASALLGWGRLEISLFDPENGRLVLAVTNSPPARAYGASKKPVCHFLTGEIAGHVRRADLFLGPPGPSPGLGEGLSRRALRGPGEHGVPDRGRVPRHLLRFDEAPARPGREFHRSARQVRRMAREESPGGRRDARDRDSGRRPLEGGRPRPRRDGRSERSGRCRCGRDRGRRDVDSHESDGPEGGPGTARSVGRREGDDRAARGDDPRTVRTRGEGGRRVRVRRPSLPGSPGRWLPVHEPVDDLPRPRRVFGRPVPQEGRNPGGAESVPPASRGPAMDPRWQGGRIQRAPGPGTRCGHDAPALGGRRPRGGRRRGVPN